MLAQIGAHRFAVLICTVPFASILRCAECFAPRVLGRGVTMSEWKVCRRRNYDALHPEMERAAVCRCGADSIYMTILHGWENEAAVLLADIVRRAHDPDATFVVGACASEPGEPVDATAFVELMQAVPAS